MSSSVVSRQLMPILSERNYGGVMGNQFASELRAQCARTVQQISAAAAEGDDLLVHALTERLADLGRIAARHGLWHD